MTNIKNEEEIIQRGYNIIIETPQWIEYIKSFNNSKGFMWGDTNAANDSVLNDIKNAIYLDNPIHSSSSLALTINRCKYLLEQCF